MYKFMKNTLFFKRKSVIKVSIILLYFASILYFYFSNLSTKRQLRRNQSNNSIIYLKVKGPGNVEVLGSSFQYLPDEIYINGFEKDEISRNYNFIDPENNVTLIWKYELTSTGEMFKGCSQIEEIHLLDFRTSRVINMSYMFYGCSSLKLVDLSVIHTSNVRRMEDMFYDCFSLKSLDLSNFNTLNVEDLGEMFYNCFSLTSLDLSNFRTCFRKCVKNVYQLYIFGFIRFIKFNYK